MFNRVWFKKLAKEQIHPNLVTLGLMMLIFMGIAMGAAIVFGIGSVMSIAMDRGLETDGVIFFISYIIMFFALFAIESPFMLSLYRAYLALTRGEKIIVSDIFWGFKTTERFWGAIKLMLLMGLYVMLWSLLLIVPGIIRGIDYSQAFFILSEDPSKGARQCIRESIFLVRGHRGDYFISGLSFILWIFVIYIPVIGYFAYFGYVYPYIMSTFANIYRFLVDEKYGEERYLN
ncbi:MAG: DUF975 family protein [Ruminococcus sp.]|jgi:uncharacterized membrane protein|nr:DUF975 family protein [Ruminococcus sp.]